MSIATIVEGAFAICLLLLCWGLLFHFQYSLPYVFIMRHTLLPPAAAAILLEPPLLSLYANYDAATPAL